MSSGKMALIGAAVVAASAGAAAAVSGAVSDDPSAGNVGPAQAAIARPAMEPAPGPPSVALRRETPAGKKGKSKRPEIIDLVSTDPVAVDPGASRIAVVACSKSQGVALDGGVIVAPPPAQVVVTTLSRANPNGFGHTRRNYYVGVRNLDPVSASTFRPTLICAKGIDVK